MNAPPGSCIPLTPEPGVETAPETKSSIPVVPMVIGIAALGLVGYLLLK